MQEAFLVTLNKMMELLGLLLIGYFMRKWKLLPEQTPKVLSGLSTKLFIPCLMLYSNIEKCTVASLSQNANLVLYGLLFALISVGCGYLLAPAFERRDIVLKRQYRYSLAVPNTGAAAIPLVMVLFDVEGVFLLGLYLIFQHVFTYSWGIVQIIPGGKNGFGATLKRLWNPVMIGVVAGMILGLLGGSRWLPGPVLTLMGNLGDCYVLAGVILAGYTIAGFDLRSILGDLKIYIFAAVRLLALPLLFLAVAWAIRAPAMVLLLTVLTFAGPCGMNPIVFGAEHGLDTKKVSGLLLVTVVVSAITLPMMYALAYKLAMG